MKIHVLYGKENACEARGIAVVVDVFRAASTAAYVLNGGAEYIIPVAHRSEALALREAHPDYILTGEYRGERIEGFDFGNSPDDLAKADVQGRVVVQRTSAGTKGLVYCTEAEVVYFASFPTLSATAREIAARRPDLVSIIALDGEGSEDELFATCLREVLEGRTPDWKSVVAQLTDLSSAQRFFDPKVTHSTVEDLQKCAAVDAFSFAILLERSEEGLRLVRVESQI